VYWSARRFVVPIAAVAVLINALASGADVCAAAKETRKATAAVAARTLVIATSLS